MLLPPAERRGEIRFLILNTLPYTMRLVTAFILITFGLVLTIYNIERQDSWWFGLPVLLAGVSFLLTRGYSNIAEIHGRTHRWRPADHAEIERILANQKKEVKWDRSLLDITSPVGVGMLVALLIGIVFSGLGLSQIMYGYVELTIAIRLMAMGAVLILPFWITGTRKISQHQQFTQKLGILAALEQYHIQFRPSDSEMFQYQLDMYETKEGDVPQDVKGMVKFGDAPPEFLGVQMQMTFNMGQPYFYCVIVAKQEYGPIELQDPPAFPRGLKLAIEFERDTGVYVIVIRRRTSKSVYSTTQNHARLILAYALAYARIIIAAKK